MSYLTCDRFEGTQLNVHRPCVHGVEVARGLRGCGDGRVFPSTAAARQWAFEHGYLQRYFKPMRIIIKREKTQYERDAIKAVQ